MIIEFPDDGVIQEINPFSKGFTELKNTKIKRYFQPSLRGTHMCAEKISEGTVRRVERMFMMRKHGEDISSNY